MARISDKRLAAWVGEIDAAAKLAGVDPQVAAADLVSEMSAATLRDLAIRYLVEQVADRRRGETLAVEREATRSRFMAESPRSGGPAVRLPKRGTREYRRWVETTEEGARYEDDMREIDQRQEVSLRRLMDGAAAAMNAFLEDQRAEWTAELLDSAIAMPDGTIVLWGDATLEQHQLRRDMFLRNAAANTEGAARHEQAIRELTETGAPTLREMVATAA